MNASSVILSLMLAAGALPPDARRELDTWRGEKDAEMRGPKSPLAYEGQRELRPGHNVLGSGAADSLRFEVPGVPERTLDLIVQNGDVSLAAFVALVSLNGQPVDVTGATALLRRGDRIEVGPLQLTLQGGARLSVSNIARPEMLGYQGLHYLPIDGQYRVESTFEAAPAGKTMSLETSQGSRRELPLRGVLKFMLAGQALSLEAFQLNDRPRDLFVVFKDATNAHETYGAGRFLWVKEPQGGKAILDFNQAWNPLCAYSPAYSCPLAPPANRLPLPIPVGEATFQKH